jgi:2-dehydropantoate 2-reductase
MDILVYGAGVIGTLYAAKLAAHGHRIVVVARAGRLAQIEANGLQIKDIANGELTDVQVESCIHLEPAQRFDLVIVSVRRDQIAAILPELAANCSPAFLFLFNNPNGTDALLEAIGSERSILGFPGAGGAFQGETVEYSLIREQPTTLGSSANPALVLKLAATLEQAGFPVKISSDMVAWLKTHAIFVTAICGAYYLSGGHTALLAKDRSNMDLMLDGVREGFTVLRALRVKIEPLPLKIIFLWVPRLFARLYWKNFLERSNTEQVIGRHAKNAPDEMQILANDCRQMIAASGAPAPSLLKLYDVIDAYALKASL